MKLMQMIKRRQMKKAFRNNAGRIASVAVAFAGVVVGIRRWRRQP
jgi:hypothetical protein